MAAAVFGEILNLLGVFLSPDFHTSAAARGLGVATPEGSAGLTRLQPAGFSADYLLARREDLDAGPGFLTTLEFVWALPPAVSIDELKRTFGPGRLVLGTDHEEHDRFEIELRGHPLRGLLAVQFEAGGFAPTVAMQSLRLVRIAPARFTPVEAAGEVIVLLEDLGATGPEPNPWPVSLTLGPLFGPDDLMGRLGPRLIGSMPGRLKLDHAELPIDFRPRRHMDLDPRVAPRLLPALAPLFDLRDGLRELESGELAVKKARERLHLESVPAAYRKSIQALLKENTPDFAKRLRELEADLAAQSAEFVAQPGFQRLARAWNHLAALFSGLDLAAGQRLEIVSGAAPAVKTQFRDGPVYDETFHPEKAPRLAIVVGPVLAADLSPESLREIVSLADQIETAVWSDSRKEFTPPPRAGRPALLVVPPLRKVVRRVETQLSASAPAERVQAAITAALVAREPGATPEVRLIRAAGSPARLTITMPLPDPGDGHPAVFRYEANWHDYR